MKLEFEDRSTLGRFVMNINSTQLKGEGMMHGQTERVNTFIFNKSKEQKVVIDQVTYIMPKNTILPLVSNQHFEFEKPDQLIAWQFNREFYCIVDHDAEVGCVGFLFHGIHHPMFISLSPKEIEGLNQMESLFLEDMELKDNMQGEMLRSLLKRLIIKITRIAKKQSTSYQKSVEDKMDIIRKFNLLLEMHFKEQHEVQFYADALHKSPKTLTNLFNLCNYPAPSKLIQKRIILEAKRYLHYTDKTSKEIAYELGYANPAHFSRFFKQKTGANVTTFRGMQFTDAPNS